MTKTINALTVATSAAVGDFVPIWRAANGDTRKITKTNFIGATISGGGTLALGGNSLTLNGNATLNGTLDGNLTGGGTLVTGGFTATVPATGSLPIKTGTPVAGRVAGWADANTVNDGNFALSDIARQSQLNTFALLQTMTAGLRSGGYSIPDQSFVQFTPPQAAGMIFVWTDSGAQVGGIGVFRKSGYMTSMVALTNLTFTNIPLTGSAGINGKATVSISINDIYIENRLGATRFLNYLLLF